MPQQPEQNGNSTPSPAPGITIPESFYSKAIKPILGKLITAGVVLILLIIVANIFLKSLKKDQTLKEMNKEIDVLKKEQLVFIKDRELLQNQLKASINFINSQHQRDSVIEFNIRMMYDKLDRIKLNNHEINKAIDHFGSPELIEYYRNLPEPNQY